MKVVSVMLALLFPFLVYSQLNGDSLKNVLSHEKTDSATTIAWLQKIETLYSSETEPLLVICSWGLNNAKKLNSRYLQAYSFMAMGFSYLYTDNADEEASLRFTDALKIAEADDFYDISAQTYNGLAHFYGVAKQTAKEDEFTLKSIEASKKSNLIQGVAYGYSGLAANIYKKNKTDPDTLRKAIYYQRMGIEAAESIKDSNALIVLYLNMAGYYTQYEKFDSANFFLARSRSVIETKKSDNDYIDYYYRRANFFYKKKMYAEARSDYDTAVLYARKYNMYSAEIKVARSQAMLYSETGDFKNAYHYLKLTKSYDDSVLTKENFAKASDFQNKYEREKKDNQILKLNMEKDIAAVKKKQLTVLLIVTMAGLGILGLLIIILFQNIRAKNKAYKQLEEKSIRIQEQALQLSKQAKLIAQFQSQMNPHFVYNALHNIQGLVLSQETQKANTQIQSLAQLMRKTFANAEKDDIPLEEEISYLQKYIEFERSGFDNTLDFEVTVDKKAEHALIPPMMIQPFVENAVKHAELQKVKNPFIKVLIEIENNLLAISVKDNGMGIKKDLNEPDKLSHSVSVIKSRLNLIFKGVADVENKPVFSIKTIPEITEGTAIKFYLPLNYSY